MNEEQVREADGLLSQYRSIQSALLNKGTISIAFEREDREGLCFGLRPSILCDCPIEHLQAELVKVKAKLAGLGVEL